MINSVTISDSNRQRRNDRSISLRCGFSVGFYYESFASDIELIVSICNNNLRAATSATAAVVIIVIIIIIITYRRRRRIRGGRRCYRPKRQSSLFLTVFDIVCDQGLCRRSVFGDHIGICFSVPCRIKKCAIRKRNYTG